MKANNTWWDITEKLPGVRQEPPTCSGNVPVVSILNQDVSHFMEFATAMLLSNNPLSTVDPASICINQSGPISTSATDVFTNPSREDSLNSDFLTCNATPEVAPDIVKGWNNVKDNLSAAMYWYAYGLTVIPIAPGSKVTVVKWLKWRQNLTPAKIYSYWKKNPTHEVGCIVGDHLIVFDADSPESIAALTRIEADFGLTSQLIVKTTKGVHHYYRIAAGTIAKSDSHSSENYPDRTDIKTGKALIILTPSTGKSLVIHTTESVDQLSEATQEFIDAINLHNGRQPRSLPPVVVSSRIPELVNNGKLQKLERLLNWIDPDCGYEGWIRAGMAIYYETAGSDDGLALFNSWSCKGKKYENFEAIEKKWQSFRPDHPTPLTIGTLIMLAREAGANTAAIMHDDAFEICQFEEVSDDRTA